MKVGDKTFPFQVLFLQKQDGLVIRTFQSFAQTFQILRLRNRNR